MELELGTRDLHRTEELVISNTFRRQSQKSADLSFTALNLVKEAVKIPSPFASHICSSSVILFSGE